MSKIKRSGQLPRLEDRRDIRHEGREFRSELGIVVGRLEEVQELLANQIAKRIPLIVAWPQMPLAVRSGVLLLW
jgi:hypothetical protein